MPDKPIDSRAPEDAPAPRAPVPEHATERVTERVTDRPADPTANLGLFAGHLAPKRFTSTEAIAVALTAIWVVAVGTFFIMTGGLLTEGDALTAAITLLAVFLTIAMIWVTAATNRTVRELREEAARLQAAVDSMRASYVQHGMRVAYVQNSQATALGIRPAMERKLDEIAAAQRQTETALATFTSRRDHARIVPSADRKAALALAPIAPGVEQPALALGTPAESFHPPVSVPDFIRALNFPDSVEDKEGFRALRTALEDHDLSRMIRAAQDVLTLLSEDGIYMDDLKPDRARPEIWRRFAQGERGPTMAVLGGVRDRSSLAMTAGRMRSDPVFRDAVHHFLRQFDRTLVSFEKNASDQDLAELTETRSARAFMLFGRVTGAFD